MTSTPPGTTTPPGPADRPAIPPEPSSGSAAGGPGADAAGRAWRNLRVLLHDRGDRRREVTEALGLSFFRVRALRRVAAGPVTLGELADRLLTDRPYATLVVEDLVRRGLAERSPNPDDRRSKIVSVTAAGRAAADEAERILDTPHPALYALPAADLAALDRIAARLVADG